MPEVEDNGCERLYRRLPPQLQALVANGTDDAITGLLDSSFQPVKGNARIEALTWVLKDAGFNVLQFAVADSVMVVARRQQELLHACARDLMGAILRLLRVAKAAGAI